MTRKEALTALLEKVEAGDWSFNLSAAAFPPESAYGKCTFMFADEAFNGSIDAAMALHEAVLHERVFVEVHWSKRYEDEARVSLNLGRQGWRAGSGTIARAWLIAIIAALIAQEGEA